MRLICLPGMDGTAELFAPFVAAAPPAITPWPLRLPDDPTLDHDALVERLRASVLADGATALLGESFSGPVALALAARLDPAPRAVVLVATFVTAPVGPWLGRLPLGWLLQRPPPRLAIEALMTGSDVPGLSREVRRVLCSVSPDVLAARIRLITRHDATDALRRCPAPVLLLAASGDRLLGTRAAQVVRRARPDVAVETIDGPHLLLQARPTACWDVIAPFLARCFEATG